MSLRAKLALVLAALAAVAVIGVGWFSYDATSDRMLSEIDNGLHASNRIAPLTDNDFGRPPGRPDRPFGIEQFVAQWLDSTGDPTDGPGDVELPVNDAEREIAITGTGESLRTATGSDGREYRMLTRGGPDGALQIGRDLTEMNAVLDSLRTRILIVGAVAVAFAALAGWFIAERLTRSLRELTTAASEVSTTGRLDIDINTDGDDEVGRLGAAFASMLAALARSREEQQRLVQDAGHELRTPLTSLRTNVDVLRRHVDLPVDVRARVLDDLDVEVAELSALVEEVVAVGTGRNSDEMASRFALVDVIDAAAERMSRRTGRTITVDADGSVVVAQRALLERAITNLLDNAAKFDTSDVPIEVTSRAGRIAVRDHGPGIAPSDLDHVFDRFYRATAARSQPGSGLGLSIVAEIAASHGGSTFAANHTEGGAEVGFQLPADHVSCWPATQSMA